MLRLERLLLSLQVLLPLQLLLLLYLGTELHLRGVLLQHAALLLLVFVACNNVKMGVFSCPLFEISLPLNSNSHVIILLTSRKRTRLFVPRLRRVVGPHVDPPRVVDLGRVDRVDVVLGRLEAAPLGGRRQVHGIDLSKWTDKKSQFVSQCRSRKSQLTGRGP